MKTIETKHIALVLLVFLGLFSCENNELNTGLEGIVYRGPINPVAVEGEMNDAPFSALFHMYSSQNKFVKSFSSNENGEFNVMLAPGKYTLKPDKSAPLLGAEFQVKEITIHTEDITQQDFYFDTGIR